MKWNMAYGLLAMLSEKLFDLLICMFILSTCLFNELQQQKIFAKF